MVGGGTRWAMIVALAACSAPAPALVHPPPVAVAPVAPPVPSGPPLLAALPAARPVATDRFPGVVTCIRCHTAGDGDHGAMRDAAGADISPVTDAAGTMMALAARDPYYLAAFRRELAAVPAGAAAIDDLCTRCHAPVGNAEARAAGGAITLDDLVRGDGDAAALGRESVGCAGCHAMQPDGLGTDAKLVGRAALRADRVMYGALPQPQGDAMIAMIKAPPVPSPHVTESALCASCHTVIVRPLDAAGHETGAEVVEQGTFLEWRSSAYASGPTSKTCQDCHQARVAAATPFSTSPPTAPARDGYRRHAIRGGNAYMLASLAAPDATSWLRAAVTPAQLTTAAAETRALLATAARLEVKPAGRDLAITVVNLTGHKLPTGFPTRRMWLHVTARDAAGQVLLESGRHAAGAILGADDARLDEPGVILPHVDRIAAATDVALWEAVPVDAAGARTHLLLGTARLAKDDRILPPAPLTIRSNPVDPRDLARTRPVGTEHDKSFLPGRDTVTLALPATTARVEIELLYQAIPPETLASYAPTDSPEAARFLALSPPPTPELLASTSWSR